MTDDKYKSAKKYIDCLGYSSSIMHLSRSEYAKEYLDLCIDLGRRIQTTLRTTKTEEFVLNSPDKHINYMHSLLLAEYIIDTYLK